MAVKSSNVEIDSVFREVVEEVDRETYAGEFSKEYNFRSRHWYKRMGDGKLFSPSIHRRFLPSQYVSMVRYGTIGLPSSPRSFTWAIRRWLALEMNNIYRMKKIPRLQSDCKYKMALLGKNIFTYLNDSERRSKLLIYGRNAGCRGAIEWSYMVSEKWIYENFDELVNSYLAMGCYYTITSLQAYGKVNGTLHGINSRGEKVSIEMTTSKDKSERDVLNFINSLRSDKVLRDSLSLDCISKLNVTQTSKVMNNFRRYIKDEEGVLEKYKVFYAKEYKNKMITKKVYEEYDIPVVGDLSFASINPNIKSIPRLYVN